MANPTYMPGQGFKSLAASFAMAPLNEMRAEQQAVYFMGRGMEGVAQAKSALNKQQAQSRLADAFRNLGLDNADDLADATNAGVSGESLNNLEAAARVNHYLQKAEEARQNGDTETSNFYLRMAHQDPLTYTEVSGGVGYNPNVRPEAAGKPGMGQSFVATPEITSRPGYNTSKTPPLSRANAQYFTKNPGIQADGTYSMGGFDQDRYADFLMWAHQNGYDTKDPNQAVMAYIAALKGGKGVTGAPGASTGAAAVDPSQMTNEQLLQALSNGGH